MVSLYINNVYLKGFIGGYMCFTGYTRSNLQIFYEDVVNIGKQLVNIGKQLVNMGKHCVIALLYNRL